MKKYWCQNCGNTKYANSLPGSNDHGKCNMAIFIAQCKGKKPPSNYWHHIWNDADEYIRNNGSLLDINDILKKNKGIDDFENELNQHVKEKYGNDLFLDNDDLNENYNMDDSSSDDERRKKEREEEKRKNEQEEINNSINEFARKDKINEEAAKYAFSRDEGRWILPREWAMENLNTDVYRNGSPISKANSQDERIEFERNKIGFYCYYKFDDSNAHLGKLYNWHAVNSENGLAPEGYRIPTLEDWQELGSYLGAHQLIGGDSGPMGARLKSETDWVVANGKGGNGNNASGLNIKPNPIGVGSYESQWIGILATFWTTTSAFPRYEKVKHWGIFTKEISIRRVLLIEIHSDHTVKTEYVDEDFTTLCVRCVKETENVGWDA